MEDAASPYMLVHELEELIVHGVRLPGAGGDGARGAVLEMVAHQLAADRPKRFMDGRDLHEDIGAVPTVIDHLLQRSHLPLDASKPLHVACLDLGVHRDRVAMLAALTQRTAWTFDHEGLRWADVVAVARPIVSFSHETFPYVRARREVRRPAGHTAGAGGCSRQRSPSSMPSPRWRGSGSGGYPRSDKAARRRPECRRRCKRTPRTGSASSCAWFAETAPRPAPRLAGLRARASRRSPRWLHRFRIRSPFRHPPAPARARR